MVGGFCEDTGVGALSDRIRCSLKSKDAVTDDPGARVVDDRRPDTRMPAPPIRPGPTIV